MSECSTIPASQGAFEQIRIPPNWLHSWAYLTPNLKWYLNYHVHWLQQTIDWTVPGLCVAKASVISAAVCKQVNGRWHTY
jgi:hypothetical protein